MKQLLLFGYFWLLVHSLAAQIGITSTYRINEAPGWRYANLVKGNEAALIGNSIGVGVDYWFRLKNYRVEFLPELNVQRFSGTYTTPDNAALEVQNNVFSLFFNTNIYLLDFFGDCDCPTFSKQGRFFKKGFFVQLSPGVSYFEQRVQRFVSPDRSNDLAFSLGAGIGFDIGITDFVTFTPLLGARYYPKVTWESLQTNNGELIPFRSIESALTQWYAGARLGLRFDYRR